MTDLYIYELEDNVWDEFEDHIVPHLNNQSGDKFEGQKDSNKKPNCEVNAVMSNNAYKSDFHGRGKISLSALSTKDEMLEKAPWSQMAESEFPDDSIKEANSMASDSAGMSNYSFKSSNGDSNIREFCTENTVMGDLSAVEETDLYRYPVSHMSETDSDLRFFENSNSHEDKGGTDQLYYGWPDLGNFDDVDRMFRTCDSTFGLESLGNEEELCWFSSSNGSGGFEDALKSNIRFSCLDDSAMKDASDYNEDPSSLNTDAKITPSGEQISCQTPDVDEPASVGCFLFENASNRRSGSRDEIAADKKASKLKLLEGKRKDRNLENGVDFPQFNSLKQFVDVKHEDGSHQLISPTGVQQHNRRVVHDASSNICTHIPQKHVDYSNPSDQLSGSSTLSHVLSINHGLPSPQKEHSFALNQVQCLDGSRAPFDTPAFITNERSENLSQLDSQASISRNFKLSPGAATLNNPVSMRKKVLRSASEMECHSETELSSAGIPAELDSSNVQESSCMSSVLDEVSLEATSFRQLQQVMEKLDIRTKLCIRDSLYRLARSAEQRHNCANSNGFTGEDEGACGISVVHDTDKTTGVMDMETDTNPIDRSIAHLLFHRPSDPSILLPNDSLPLKSHPLVLEDDTAGGMDKHKLINGNR